MKEILFKAKRIDNGEWIEGGFCQSSDGKTYIIGVSKRGCIDGLEVVPETVCQYTGLADKNGNKIWENDIVKKHFYTDYDAYANSEEYIGIVEFTDCAWVIKTKNANRECSRPIIESLADSHDVEYFEVIGNIFDNVCFDEISKGGD